MVSSVFSLLLIRFTSFKCWNNWTPLFSDLFSFSQLFSAFLSFSQFFSAFLSFSPPLPSFLSFSQLFSVFSAFLSFSQLLSAFLSFSQLFSTFLHAFQIALLQAYLLYVGMDCLTALFCINSKQFPSPFHMIDKHMSFSILKRIFH